MAALVDKQPNIEPNKQANIEALAVADLAVLSALLACTGSAVMRLCFNSISAAVGQLANLRSAMYAAPQTNVAGWRALLAWLQTPAPRGVADVAALLAARDKITLAAIKAAA